MNENLNENYNIYDAMLLIQQSETYWMGVHDSPICMQLEVHTSLWRTLIGYG